MQAWAPKFSLCTSPTPVSQIILWASICMLSKMIPIPNLAARLVPRGEACSGLAKLRVLTGNGIGRIEKNTIMGSMGIMEKKMETTIMGSMGIMEKKMETTIMGTRRRIRSRLGHPGVVWFRHVLSHPQTGTLLRSQEPCNASWAAGLATPHPGHTYTCSSWKLS